MQVGTEFIIVGVDEKVPFEIMAKAHFVLRERRDGGYDIEKNRFPIEQYKIALKDDKKLDQYEEWKNNWYDDIPWHEFRDNYMYCDNCDSWGDNPMGCMCYTR